MPSLPAQDLQRMRDQLMFDGPDAGRKLTRFWVLLILAGIIATAGVISDSTATVIGAMIVAPLMTPILGIVVAVATADSKNLLRSIVMVLAGAAAVVFIGWAFGHLAPVDIVAANNSQVGGRVHPRIIDLIAALATGCVGAFALARSDVSDTLPGVAIAISLVPPLAVVGLTLEAGAGSESLGALLLFSTNVVAILLSGLAVMALFRVSETARTVAAAPANLHQRAALVVVIAMIVILSIPLGAATVQLTRDRLNTGAAAAAAEEWAQDAGWRVTSVEVDNEGIAIRAFGPLPEPSPEALRAELDERGLGDIDVTLNLVPESVIELPAR